MMLSFQSKKLNKTRRNQGVAEFIQFSAPTGKARECSERLLVKHKLPDGPVPMSHCPAPIT